MSNTAVEVINSKYRCFDRGFDRLSSSLGSAQNDQKPGRRYPRASAVWPACSLPHPNTFS